MTTFKNQVMRLSLFFNPQQLFFCFLGKNGAEELMGDEVEFFFL